MKTQTAKHTSVGTAMKRNWMPEPWELGGCSGRMIKTPYGDKFAADFDTSANAQRAVSCVNALAGVENPEKAVKRLVNAARRVFGYVSTGTRICPELDEMVEEFRAALKSFEVKP